MVYLNNLLSLPLAFAMAAATGELAGVVGDPALRRPAFAAAALASALLAFCISFTALWRAPVAGSHAHEGSGGCWALRRLALAAAALASALPAFRVKFTALCAALRQDSMSRRQWNN